MRMEKEIKEYSNNDITVVWNASKCIHSAICLKNSPKVFDTQVRSWINLSNGETDEIISTVDKCPSGALSYFRK